MLSPQSNTISVGLTLIANSVNDTGEIAMLARWRREYDSFNARRARRQTILVAVRDGYDTLAEIVAHTGIPTATARRIVLELMAKKRIVCLKTKNANNRIELRYEIAVSF